MKRISVNSQGLAIASAITDRLGYLLPGSDGEGLAGGKVDRAAMYSEAARRETFTKWPHMNYKWVPWPYFQSLQPGSMCSLF